MIIPPKPSKESVGHIKYLIRAYKKAEKLKTKAKYEEYKQAFIRLRKQIKDLSQEERAKLLYIVLKNSDTKFANKMKKHLSDDFNVEF